MERMNGYEYQKSQVGYITECIEPISDKITLRDALGYFANDPDVEAMPVEIDTGYSIVSREDIQRKKGQLGAMGRTVSTLEDLYADSLSISSQENVKKVLRDVIKNSSQKYFLVFKERNLMGIVSLRNLVRHNSDIQEQEIRQGREVQDFLLSENLIQGKGFHLKTSSQRAHDLGSDYYYSTELTSKLSMVCCFEVQGSIQGASLVSVMIDTYMKTRKMTGSLETDKPENRMLSLNTFLCRHTPDECTVRCIFLFIDLEKELLSIYNFDYTSPFLILMEEGKVKAKMPTANFKALGREELVIFREKPKQISLNGLKHIFLYSDGLENCVNVNGQAFGMDRIKDCLMENFKSLGSGFSEVLEKQVNDFRREMPVLEDITTMVISFD
jgi:sigma-B regulation protein RsbU (phosphoserine phosphatase)